MLLGGEEGRVTIGGEHSFLGLGALENGVFPLWPGIKTTTRLDSMDFVGYPACHLILLGTHVCYLDLISWVAGHVDAATTLHPEVL